MEYTHLGQSGLKVSLLGLGTNSFGSRADKATSIRLIHRALDAGVALLDTANGYSGGQSEMIVGEALDGRRERAVIATKAGLPVGDGPYARGTSRRHLLQQVEQSLSRLKTDYIDLFYVHTFDEETPLEETVRTLDDMVRQGKVRYIGASNYTVLELTRALGIADVHGWERFVALQPSYSLLDRTPEVEMVPLLQREGLGMIAYYPLAGGLLTGKYRRGEIPQGSRMQTQSSFQEMVSQRMRQAADKFADLAEQFEVDPGVLALAWLIRRPTVASAIVGATRVEQLEKNLTAVDVSIPAELQRELDALSDPFVDSVPFGWYRLL